MGHVAGQPAAPEMDLSIHDAHHAPPWSDCGQLTDRRARSRSTGRQGRFGYSSARPEYQVCSVRFFSSAPARAAPVPRRRARCCRGRCGRGSCPSPRRAGAAAPVTPSALANRGPVAYCGVGTHSLSEATVTDSSIRLAVDIGGTFTDIVVEAGAQRWTRKVLTTPQAPEQAVIAGTLELLGDSGDRPRRDRPLHPRHDARDQRHHRAQGRRHRPHRHRGLPRHPRYRRRGPLRPVRHLHRQARSRWCRATAASPCRSASMPPATCCRPLDEAAVHALLPELDRLGVASVAVAFLHSYASAGHERRVREILVQARPRLARHPLQRGLPRDARI